MVAATRAELATQRKKHARGVNVITQPFIPRAYLSRSADCPAPCTFVSPVRLAFYGLEPFYSRPRPPESLPSHRAHARPMDTRRPARRPAIRAARDGARSVRRCEGPA